jgi:hypothetical protein
MEESSKKASVPLLELDYRLNRDEIKAVLQHDNRINSRWIKIIQTAVLAVLAGYFLIGFITDQNRNFSGIVMSCISLLIIVLIWISPKIQINNKLLLEEQNEIEIHLRLFDEKIRFSKSNVFAISECKLFKDGDTLILDTGQQLVGIPKRVAGEEGFNLLLDKFDLN